MVVQKTCPFCLPARRCLTRAPRPDCVLFTVATVPHKTNKLSKNANFKFSKNILFSDKLIRRIYRDIGPMLGDWTRNRTVCSAHVWDGREHSILGQRPRPDGRPEDGAGVPGRGTRAEEGR